MAAAAADTVPCTHEKIDAMATLPRREISGKLCKCVDWFDQISNNILVKRDDEICLNEKGKMENRKGLNE